MSTSFLLKKRSAYDMIFFSAGRKVWGRMPTTFLRRNRHEGES